MGLPSNSMARNRGWRNRQPALYPVEKRQWQADRLYRAGLSHPGCGAVEWIVVGQWGEGCRRLHQSCATTIYTGAIAIWPVRTNEQEWKLELDVEYVGWKSNRDLDVHLSSGGVIPQPQQWKTVRS